MGRREAGWIGVDERQRIEARVGDVGDTGRGGADIRGDRDWRGAEGISEDVAVDDIAEAPEDLADRGEERAAIQHEPAIDAHARRENEEDQTGPKDRAEERQAAVPDRDDVDRIK